VKFVKSEALALFQPTAPISEARCSPSWRRRINASTFMFFDDASPNPSKPGLKNFRRSGHYFSRYTENMGGRSLTGHWSRCIALTRTVGLGFFLTMM